MGCHTNKGGRPSICKSRPSLCKSRQKRYNSQSRKCKCLFLFFYKSCFIMLMKNILLCHPILMFFFCINRHKRLGFISFVIFQTILHEIGHTLGLNHSLVPGSIMSKAHPVKQLSITPSKYQCLGRGF